MSSLAFTHGGTLYFVLSEEALQRVQQHDPFEFNARMAKASLSLTVPLQIVIAYADAADMAHLVSLQDDVDAVLQYLYRGYQFTDSDRQRAGGYKPL